MTDDLSQKKILITGGLGFIGSNLAIRLVSLGAKVTILDSMNPLYGGNLFNIHDIKDKAEVIIGDIRDKELVDKSVKNKDVIFDFAAQIRHTDSINMPFEDLAVNCGGRLNILEACRNFNRDVKIVFSSSRMVYGKAEKKLIDEKHPTNPLGLYGIHKLAAEKYFLTYFNDFGIRSSILRISNPYGERQQIKHGKYSIPGYFLGLAMKGENIKIFGDGMQLRDYIYISDLVDALVFVAFSEKTNGEIYNCAFGKFSYFKEMAEEIIRVVGKGKIEYTPWPEEYRLVETGDSEMDISKLVAASGFSPKIGLKDGIGKIFEYYSKYKENYI